MKTLRRYLVTCFGLFVAVGISILTMIYGWGLEPKSWLWIIGIGCFGNIFAHVIISIGVDNSQPAGELDP